VAGLLQERLWAYPTSLWFLAACIARKPYVFPSWHICLGGQRRSITSQPHDETASFTIRNVSSQIEQSAVKTSIVLFPAIPFISFLVLRPYIPVQQHMSSVLPVSLHSNFPSFCFSQQHVFTSLLVRVHTIFEEAPDAIVRIKLSSF
jgi:hypothetical protein